VVGHVFVVRGHLEDLQSDAVVITTDQRFSVDGQWQAVHRSDDVTALQPLGWGSPQVRYGRSADGRPLWFLDVTLAAGESLKDMLLRLRSVVGEIASAGLPTAGRQVPLLTMPVPSIGHGGFHGSSGQVIDALLRTLSEVVADLPLDVALAAADPAAYAAVQARRRQLGEWPEGIDLAEVNRLADLARSGGLALFLGAGLGMPSGLPSWSALVEELAESSGVRDSVDKDEWAGLTLLEKAELLQRRLGPMLRELLVERCGSLRPSLSHALLAGLGCREVITTGYDRCYERAVASQGITQSTVVLPWQLPKPGRPWLLKLHGDVDHPASIDFTRAQLADGNGSRPAGSLLQALLLTKHLLVVGASTIDDNVLRLTQEVRQLRHRSGVEDELGTVLSLRPQGMGAGLWEGDLTWVSMAGRDESDGPRRLEVFLDALSAHACDDAAYLLDERFADLLGDEERRVVSGLRQLKRTIDQVVRVAGHRQEWRELQCVLSGMGADAKPASTSARDR
jgi:hypothetical protein